MLRKRFSAIIGLVILIVAAAACGDPITNATGIVKDENGNPLAEVKVLMESNGNSNGDFMKESEQVTKNDGAFDFGEITAPADKVRLIFSKEGYKTFTKELTPNRDNNFDVKLEKQ